MSMKNLFEAASSKFELNSTLEEFESKMAVPQRRRAVYDAMQQHYTLPSFEEFDTKVQSYLAPVEAATEPEGGIFGKGGPFQQFPRRFLAGGVEFGLGIADLAQRLYEFTTPEDMRPYQITEEEKADVRLETEEFIKSIKSKPAGVLGYIGATAGALAEFVAETALVGGVLRPLTKARALWMASKVPKASKYGQLSRYMVNKVASDAPVFTTVHALKTEGGLGERAEAGIQGLKMSLVFGLLGAIPGRVISYGTIARVPLGNILLGTNPIDTQEILSDKTISREEKLIRLVDTAINSWFTRKGATAASLQSLHKNIEMSYRSQGKRVPDYISKSIKDSSYSGQILTKAPEPEVAKAPAKKVVKKPSPSRRMAEDVDEIKFIEAKVKELGSIKDVKNYYTVVSDVSRYAKKYAEYMFGVESGIVPEWGTRNQYYTKSPYRQQLDKMKRSGKYDEDILAKAEQWELEQVLKDKPGYLHTGKFMKEAEVVDFAKKHGLSIGRDKQNSLVVAKDEYNLQKIISAKQGRELGIALGYEDVKPIVKDTNYSPPEVKPAPYNPADKILEIMKLSGPARALTKVLQHEELQKRAGKLTKIYAEGKGGGTETARAARRALKGKLPKAAFDPPGNKMTQADIDALNKTINTTSRITLPFERVHASDGLYKTLLGELPTSSEIRILGRVFGPAFSRMLYSKRTRGQKAWQTALDYASIPRTVMTMWDMSAAGRQGMILGVRRPDIWLSAVKTGFKSIRRESVAVAVEEAIRENVYYKLSQSGKDRLYIAERGIPGAISAAEESFMSKTALRIPGAKWSERAYVTTLNKLRMDTFASTAKKWEGTNKTAQDYSDLAKYVNEASGRGTFTMHSDAGAALNALFFSPRFVASRIQVPLRLLTSTPAVRKIVAGDLVAFVGANLTMLALASQIPGVDVEVDPRSSDFGKVRIGDTRIDTWAGYTPIARFVTQFASSRRKSVGTGRVIDIERWGVVERFIQSKLSPMAGLGVDIARGRTFTGEDVTARLPDIAEGGLASVIEDPNILKQIWSRLTPMFVQDVAEAIRYQGLAGGFVSVPAFLGLGVQTYPESAWTKTSQYKDMVSNDNFGMSWDDLDVESQTTLRQYFPNIEEMEREAKMDSDATLAVKRSMQQHQESAEDIRERLPKDIQDELDRLLVKVTGVSRRIYSNWNLNDRRYEEYKNTTADILNVILPELMNDPQWQSATVAEQRWAVEESLIRAKKEARMHVLMNANRSMFRRVEANPAAGLP